MIQYTLILSITITILFGISPGSAVAQSPHYDFDSLLQHNPGFETMARQVFDTFQIFGPEEPLELTVSTDFRHLLKNKYENEYQPATVIYQLWDSINISREIRIKPRGELRLKVCSQPPLMINVKKTEKVFQLLDDLDKLKLVVPCKGISAYQEYIYSEYLIYKLYNILTDYSFKVRMIQLQYFDTGGKIKPGQGHTFIIESHKSLAKRKQSIPIENENLNMNLIDPKIAAIMFVFQYMIGNTDWTVHGLHNVKLIKTMDPAIPNPIPVPYDFDYAGLVNATYAVPSELANIDRVTDRAYMGVCLPEEVMEQTFEHFLAKEKEIMESVTHDPYMSEPRKKTALKFLEQFFDTISVPKKRKFEIINKCLN